MSSAERLQRGFFNRLFKRLLSRAPDALRRLRFIAARFSVPLSFVLACHHNFRVAHRTSAGREPGPSSAALFVVAGSSASIHFVARGCDLGGSLRARGHGVLLQEPEKLPQRSRWTIRALRVWHPTGAEEISGDILITVRAVSRDWRYGDRIRFRIEPLAPRDSGNPGGFDYAAFLARRGIYATGFLVGDQGVELLSRAPPGPWSALESLRREIRRLAGLASGFILLSLMYVGKSRWSSRELGR